MALVYELLPCPFCSSDRIRFQEWPSKIEFPHLHKVQPLDDMMSYLVDCEDCRAQKKVFGYNKIMAYTAWNTRADKMYDWKDDNGEYVDIGSEV